MAEGIAREQIESHGDVVRVTATTAQIESAFATDMRFFGEPHARKQRNKQRRFARALGTVSIPLALRGDVHMIGGLTELVSRTSGRDVASHAV